MSTAISHHQQEADDTVAMGFWIYLMTDLIMFSVLFACFAVLRNNIHTGPSGAELFSLPFVLVETLLLLTSSFTSGLGMLAIHRQQRRAAITWFVITFALGAAFLGMEIYEFSHLIHQGHSWQASAFLSSYFGLVGTHGLHILGGLIWLAILLGYTLKRGFTPTITRKFNLLSIFWHFLDIVWIFIFTIVYLMGVV